VSLHTDERHEERAAYEAEAKARRLEAEATARAAAEAAAETERRAIAEMRKRMEFKARPVPSSVLIGKPVTSGVAVVKRALTVAMSPKFQTAMRSLARRQAQQASALADDSRC
jgi:septum formation inhibitor MinC